MCFVERLHSKLLADHIKNYIELKQTWSGIADISDFSWKYLDLKLKLDLKVVSIRTSGQVKIIGTLINQREIARFIRPIEFTGEHRLIIPVKGKNSVLFIENQSVLSSKVYLAGIENNSFYSISPIGLSTACNVVIKSEPSDAEIFFNNVRYHNKTDTNSVREPGEISVRINKIGYKQWREKRLLSSGDVWNINAKLEFE